MNFSHLEEPCRFLIRFSSCWTIKSQRWESSYKKKEGSPTGFYSRVQVHSSFSGTVRFSAGLSSLFRHQGVSPPAQRELGDVWLCLSSENAAANSSETETITNKTGSRLSCWLLPQQHDPGCRVMTRTIKRRQAPMSLFGLKITHYIKCKTRCTVSIFEWRDIRTENR